jgi:hypothetical protein
LVEVGIVFADLELNLFSLFVEPHTVEILVDELDLLLIFGIDILLKVANLLEVDWCWILVSEVTKFPVVDDLNFRGLVLAFGKTVDEAWTVGGDVDAGGVVYLLDQGVSLLVLVLARRPSSALALRL